MVVIYSPLTIGLNWLSMCRKNLNLKLDTFAAQHSSIAQSSVNVTIGDMEDIMKFAKSFKRSYDWQKSGSRRK